MLLGFANPSRHAGAHSRLRWPPQRQLRTRCRPQGLPAATGHGVTAKSHIPHRMGWLRAVVLAANDGTIAVACLVVGIAASGAHRPALLLPSQAARVAGAASMAGAEYVSLQSPVDTERADLAREREEPVAAPDGAARCECWSWVWGSLPMGLTAAVGQLFRTVVWWCRLRPRKTACTRPRSVVPPPQRACRGGSRSRLPDRGCRPRLPGDRPVASAGDRAWP
jgi:hypothetical protein